MISSVQCWYTTARLVTSNGFQCPHSSFPFADQSRNLPTHALLSPMYRGRSATTYTRSFKLSQTCTARPNHGKLNISLSNVYEYTCSEPLIVSRRSTRSVSADIANAIKLVSCSRNTGRFVQPSEVMVFKLHNDYSYVSAQVSCELIDLGIAMYTNFLLVPSVISSISDINATVHSKDIWLSRTSMY